MLLLDTLNLMSDFYGLELWQMIILMLLLILLVAIYVDVWARKDLRVHNREKRFRFEITGYANHGVRIGVYTAAELSGQGISDILTTALPVIGKKDPHLLRLMLFHCLEAMEEDEQISGALVRFHEDLGQSLSDS